MKKFILTFLLVGVLVPNVWAQSAELIRQNARLSLEYINKRDIKGFQSLLSQQCVDYQSPEPIKGVEAVTKSIQEFLSAFPDYSIGIIDIAVAGNKAYIYNTFRGTHTKNLMQIPPTGKIVEWRDVDIMEFDKEGKIVAHWVNNPNAVLDQLGYHALTNPATQLVMMVYDRFGKGDMAGLADLLTEDIQWDVMDNPIRELANQYTNKDGVKQHLSKLMNTITISKFQPYRFFAEGDEVTVFIDAGYMTLSDSKAYDCRLIHHFQVRDHKVSSFREFSDRPRATTMAAK